jgi:glycosyltransferase involved in cell wall biosynthesis
MRFLMLNWRDPANPKSGGAERVSLAYLSALADRGHEVFWFANDFGGAAPQELIRNIQIVRGGGQGSSVLKAIQWYRRQPRFDLVIDQHHGIPWYAPWWCKTNCIAYIHEVLGPIWESFYRWPLSTFGRWQERWTHWMYRKVPFWTPSESTRRDLYRNGVRDVTVIPNGCDTIPLIELEPKKLELPLKLVTVCRLAPNKRVDHAIRIVKALLAREIDARLTIIGTGEVELSLRDLAKNLGLANRIDFTGPLTEEKKNLQLRQAHFLVHTSVREGWGLNVLEANAMGTPAIVYPVAGLVDSTIDGETGVVTNGETPVIAAAALQKVFSAPEKYLALRIQAWNRSKEFQWKNVLPKACVWLEEQASKRRM